MRFLLAVDGGGTKTKVLCADEDGNIVGEGLSGPTNLTATNVGAASFNLREAIRQATEKLPQGYEVIHMVMGLAGMDTIDEEQKARKVFGDVLRYFPIQNFDLVNDIVIGLESGTQQENAVAIIAGTGSNCYGRNEQGHEVKVGGMDYLLTDQGSGYQIGVDVLRTAVKSYDGRIEKSLLQDLVCRHFQIDSVAHLKSCVYNPVLNKAEVAQLTKICEDAHNQGDAAATAILDRAIDELVLMLRAALTKLDLIGKGVDCVLVGGVTKIPYVHEKIDQKVREFCPNMSLNRPEKEPVYGALSLAMKRKGKVVS